jgi:hypothetical protein
MSAEDPPANSRRRRAVTLESRAGFAMPEVTVAISPSELNMFTGRSQQFAASLRANEAPPEALNGDAAGHAFIRSTERPAIGPVPDGPGS